MISKSFKMKKTPMGFSSTSIPALTNTNQPSGASVTPAEATQSRAAPFRYEDTMSDRTPNSIRGIDHTQVDRSRPPVALGAAVEEQRVWPQSVNAGSVWGPRFVDSCDKRGDDGGAVRGPVNPAPSVRPKNLGRGRGQRRREQENAAPGPCQVWGAVREERVWTGSTSGTSLCSARISRWDRSSRTESRSRADDDMDWRSSCSQPAAADVLGGSRFEAPASGSRPSEVPTSRTFHLTELRNEGMRLAGVGSAPAPSFGQRVPLRRPNTSAPPLTAGTPAERKNGESASKEEKPTSAGKPAEPVPLAPALPSAAPTLAGAGENSWQHGKPWPQQAPGLGSPPGLDSTLPPASWGQAATHTTCTGSDKPETERPTRATRPAADSRRPLGIGLRGPTYPTAAADPSEVGGSASVEVPSSRHDGLAGTGKLTDHEEGELMVKLANLSISHSGTGDAHWKLYWWLYKDDAGDVQGPFSPAQMMDWFAHGFLSTNLMMKRVCDMSFKDLGTLIKTWRGLPFAAGVCVSMPPQP